MTYHIALIPDASGWEWNIYNGDLWTEEQGHCLSYECAAKRAKEKHDELTKEGEEA